MGLLQQFIQLLLGKEYGADADSVARDAGNALALLAGGSTQAAGANFFTFQPGGVAAPGVYTTSAALLAALPPADAHGNRPPSVVQIDDSFTSPAPLVGGNFDSVTFDCVPDTSLTGGAVLLLSGTVTASSLRFRGGLAVQWNQAGDVWTAAAGKQTNLWVSEDCSFTRTGGAGHFLNVPATAVVDVIANEGDFGNGTFAVAAAGSLTVQADGHSNFGATSITANAAATLALLDYTASVTGVVPMANVTEDLTDDSSRVVYTNGAPVAVAPTIVSAALDQLYGVLRNYKDDYHVGGPANPLTFAATSFTPVESGLVDFDCTVQVSSATAGFDSVTLTLLVGGVAMAGAPTVTVLTPSVGIVVEARLRWTSVPLSLAAHNFAVEVSATGNLTGAATYNLRELLS